MTAINAKLAYALTPSRATRSGPTERFELLAVAWLRHDRDRLDDDGRTRCG